ncbi:hypothetical protein DPMN_034642 [Dreissena polymorpha]|uniref:Uncharacterized protein n=1 Tax=Dreissena polymorpha TaxID=45954 RepID=A0A9D4RM97_DREPO|nr:hypothetical protein DPMN_034642 [Dreissena polymorpha]
MSRWHYVTAIRFCSLVEKYRFKGFYIQTRDFKLDIGIRPGILTPLGMRSDVDRELVLYFDSIDEGKSWLVHENLERCGDPAECKRLADAGDPDFEESLKKDSINGNYVIWISELLGTLSS